MGLNLGWAFGIGAVAAALMSGASARVGAQQGSAHAHSPAAVAPTAAPSGGPRRVSEDELHRHGGIPRGWKFSVPGGAAERGRELFRELECYKCHEIKTEKFPAPADGKYTGPELTGMGRIHPREYIAESILFPDAVIVDEPGTTGPDGLSLMPSFAESLSLAQWVDLVAFLEALTEGGEHPESHDLERVTTAGEYRVRLVYADGGHQGRAGHHGTAAARPAGHLMAFITEQQSGEAVPYLPVTLTVQATGTARRTLTLRPMLGDDGLHYGADVALPRRTTRLTLVIGPATVRTLGTAKARWSKPAAAVFEWGAGMK